MAEGIVTVGKRQYACGLYWENSPSGRVAQAAREAARQPSTRASFYAVRAGNKSGRIPQFGLSQGGLGYKAGLPALAASMADQQPGSWAGAFRLREGIAVIIVRDDLIVPDGDLFFVDESEARDRLLQELALGGLTAVYAPENWGVPSADSMPISLLLNDQTFVRLKPVSLGKDATVLAAVGAGIVAIVIGIGWYMAAEKAKQEELERARLAAMEAARKQAESMYLGSKAPEYPPHERFWEKAPTPAVAIQACRDVAGKLKVVVAGWRLDSIECSQTSVVQSWSRTGGQSRPPEGASVDVSGTKAVITQPIVDVPVRGSEALWSRNEVTNAYLVRNWPGPVAPMPDDPLPSPPSNHKGEWNPPRADWVKRSFSVTTPALPGPALGYFDGIPGIIVKSMKSSTTGLKSVWTIEGVIYENRQ